MAQEEVTIIRIGTEEAVRSIADLKENIKQYKAALDELEIGTEDYKNVLTELETNQAALRNAMHGTATSMEQIAAAAKGQDESYNGLVRTMAKYKEELRAIDTSTAEGTEAFKNKAKQIQVVNDKLKNLDALQGNYQRNVGNYKSALDGLSGAFKATAGSAGSVINPIAGMTAGLKALSATPAIAILGLLANLLTKIAEGFKSDEDNMNALNLAMSAFKPIADALTRTLQGVANVIAGIAQGIVDLLDNWGLLSDAAKERMQMESDSQQLRKEERRILVENARLEAEATELRAKAAEKDKVSASERLKMLQQASDMMLQIEKNNTELAEERLRLAKQEASLSKNSAEVNDKIAQMEAAAIQARVRYNTTQRRLNREMSATRLEMARGAEKATKLEEKAAKDAVTSYEKIIKMWEEADRKREAAEKWMADDLKGVMSVIDSDMDATTAAVQAMLDAQLQAEWDAAQEEKRIQQQRLATFFGFTNALSDIAGSIADIYEADSEADEQAAHKAKALRTASAIIATISGAVSAFTSTWSAAELPYTAKMVLAPTNAAAVLAAGYAQVKQINAVKVGDSTGGGAAVPAPAFSPAVSQVRNITGASEEERLNRMASNQRVYLVYSDLEIANTAQRVKVRETEF